MVSILNLERNLELFQNVKFIAQVLRNTFIKKGVQMQRGQGLIMISVTVTFFTQHVL